VDDGTRLRRQRQLHRTTWSTQRWWKSERSGSQQAEEKEDHREVEQEELA